MDWEKLGVKLRRTETHLDAWQQILRDAPLRLMRVPPEERDPKMERLCNVLRPIMAELQQEQSRLHKVRSRKLARLFRLQRRATDTPRRSQNR